MALDTTKVSVTYAKCHYSECRLCLFMPSVANKPIMLSFVILSIVTLNLVILSVVVP
jgi:hypothetical protein